MSNKRQLKKIKDLQVTPCYPKKTKSVQIFTRFNALDLTNKKHQMLQYSF